MLCNADFYLKTQNGIYFFFGNQKNFKINFIFIITKNKLMDTIQHEQYEYARKRLRQKKGLYFHFVLLVLGSLFLFVTTHFDVFGFSPTWTIWAITVWVFLFVLHFIKVFITDRFMNKNWERTQTEKLMALQEKKIAQLETKIEAENAAKTK